MVCTDVPRVLAAAARLVTEARSRVAWYAGAFAPVRTDQVAELLRTAGCVLAVAPLGGGVSGMALPRLQGLVPIVVSDDTSRTARMFVLRHELAHVLAGEVEEPTYLTEDDCMSFSERTADLFALADLVPGWMLTDLRRSRMPWRDVLDEVRYAVRESSSDEWSAERIEDRAALRLRLFREYGI
jgi:hypothetical protein